jgi:rhodanese-related sulfurtransferase
MPACARAAAPGDYARLMSDAHTPAAPGQRTPLDLDPARLAEWLQEGAGIQVIDVREQYERDAGHIASSRHIELPALAQQAASIDREQLVVVYCRVGSRSTMAAQALRGAGYEAYSLAGGLVRWVAEGRPLVPEGGYVAEH